MTLQAQFVALVEDLVREHDGMSRANILGCAVAAPVPTSDLDYVAWWFVEACEAAVGGGSVDGYADHLNEGVLQHIRGWSWLTERLAAVGVA